MLFGALIIDLLFIGLGVLMRYTAFDPNPAFGYRTTRSMQSPEAWAYANRKAGSLMAIVGLVGLALSIATAVIDAATPLTTTDAGFAVASFLYVGIPLVGIVAVIPVVERDLKKLFPSDAAASTDPDEATPSASAAAPASVAIPMSTARKALFGALCVLPLIIAACGFGALPDTVAVHFDASGPDGWAPRTQVFLFAAIMAASNLVLACAYRVFLRRQTSARSRTSDVLAFVAFAVCMLVASAAVLYIVLFNIG